MSVLTQPDEGMHKSDELYIEQIILSPRKKAVVLTSKCAALQHMGYCAAANVLPHNAVAEQQTFEWQQSQHASCLMATHVLISCIYVSSISTCRSK